MADTARAPSASEEHRMKPNRLAGHSLPNEGRIYDGSYRIEVGPTACSCGAPSPVLRSDNERRVWHRRHKDEARQSAGQRGGTG